jgi:putative PIN family toxin of toxin-antitoxin system
MKKQTKLVLDTNLFIAAHFNKKSASAKIIDLCLTDKFKVYTAESLFKELEFILKNIRAPIIYKEKIYQLFNKANLVKPKKIWLVEEDPDDNKFLGTSLSAKADYLLTNDRHLLKIKKFNKTEIIKPIDFLANIVKKGKNY